MSDRKYIVLGGEHYNPLGLVRSLGVAKIKPIAIIKRADFGITSKSKYISKLHLVDSNKEGLDLLIKEYGNEKEKPFVLTSDDQMTSLLDKNYNSLKDKFIFYNAGEEGRITKYMNKGEITALAVECGLKVPRTWKVKNKIIPQNIIYPVFTKALISTKDYWKKDSCICNNKKELQEILSKINEEEILVQEYIVKKNELSFDGYSCNKGENVLYSIEINYLYNNNNSFGHYMKITNGKHKDLERKLDLMFKKIGFEGIMSADFLVDNDDNYYFLEINFRNSAWSWASTIAGMNLPILWSKSTIDKKTFKTAYREFKPFKAMVEFGDFHDRVRTKQVSFFKWILELFGTKVKFYWYYKDPKPIFSKFMHKINKKHY